MNWDSEAAGWDDNPAVKAYNQAAFVSLVESCGQRGISVKGAKALDFGCGTGLLTEALAASAAAVTAVDISAAMVAVLRDKIQQNRISNVQALHGAVETLGLAGDYDLITCSSVCGFLPDYPGTAKTLAGLLRPGGLFIQWDWAWTEGEGDEPGYGLRPEEIRAALEGAGLKDVVVDTGFSLPFEEMVMAPLRGVGQRA